MLIAWRGEGMQLWSLRVLCLPVFESWEESSRRRWRTWQGWSTGSPPTTPSQKLAFCKRWKRFHEIVIKVKVPCSPNPLVDVHCEDGGARVEHRGEGGHESGEHHRHEEAAQTNLKWMRNGNLKIIMKSTIEKRFLTGSRFVTNLMYAKLVQPYL